jgi:protocatechuate 3,4-dioxygenase beta subunit
MRKTVAARTDARGVARFERVTRGKAVVTVAAPGAAVWVRVLQIDANTKALNVVLQPEAPLAGQVVDDAGTPIANARLRALPLAGPDPGFQAKSDAQGQFRVAELAAGEKYAIEAEALYHELSVVPEVAAPADGLRIVLQRTSSLAGVVLDAEGKPASGALVRIAGSGIWPARELTAGADGRFALEKVSGGVYELRAQRGNFTSAPEEGVVVAPASEAFVRLRLEPGATLRGKVLDAQTGTPLVAAKVVVTEDALSSLPVARDATTDGSFAIEGLRALPHRLFVTAPGYVAIAGETLVPGGAARELRLARSATLAGLVVDERGEPVAQASLEVTGTTDRGEPLRVSPELPGQLGTGLPAPATPPPAGDNLGVTGSVVPRIPLTPTSEPMSLAPALQTDRAGCFEITGVPAGKAQLLVRRPGYALARSSTLQVHEGARLSDLRITLTRGAVVNGRVEDGRGFPVAGVRVTLAAAADPWPRVTVSHEDGGFVFEAVPLGKATLQALPLREAVAERELELTGARGPEVVLQLSSESRTLLGRVLDPRGFPIEAAVVRVQGQGAHAATVRSTVSAPDGTFEASGLPSPPFFVFVEHPAYAPVRQVSEAPHQKLSVTLRAGALVTGLVQDARKGEGVGAVVVHLRGQAQRELRSARTTARGAFEFRNLTLDEYELSVTHEGFVPARYWFSVEATKPLELPAIALQPAGSVSGEVVDQLGAPVRGAEVCAGDRPCFERPVLSDPLGRFRVQGVEPGERSLWARHARAGELDRPVPVRVFPDQETPGLIVRLPSPQ